ncbi:serine/threonine-protein kinase [Lentisalinibacter salinarum]|uniref:serine/threonine-protein kinase n=1 Tax=Lentisalinibacter salinarum TaxID=2992239 RepID=UPI003867DA41
MAADRFQRVKQIFNQLADLPPDERAARLDAACGSDRELRAEVEALLAGADASDATLRRAVGSVAAEALEDSPASSVGRLYGPWRLTRLVARGGMGAVYLAERADGSYEQQAAVKLVNAALMSPLALRRFDDERRILARLQHPNIARLIDGGKTADGEPWLAMEYVDGLRIDEYCRARGLDTPARLALFRKVCAAIDYAHRNLVVHRDIKPSNILVDSEGEPKVLDFGLARLFEDECSRAAPTVTERRALTPLYASPEQLKGEPLTISTDVYSLSVLLYELLAGTSPYEASANDPAALHFAICDGDREPPSLAATRDAGVGSGDGREAARALKGDLDNIVLKGMRAEVERRYGTVSELVEDIERYLRDEPVMARPDTWQYRTSKFLKRRRSAVLASAGVIAVIATLSTLFIQRIIAERDAAEAAQARAEQMTAFLTDLFASADRFESAGEEITVRDLLDAGAARIRTELADQPVERARLMQRIADTYNALSLNEEAAALSREAWDIRREALGDRHVETLGSKRNYADFARLAGNDVDESIALLREVLAAQIDTVGPASHEVASTRNAIATALRYKGDQLGALEEFQAALAILEGLPPGHGDRRFRVNVLNQIGNINESLDDVDGAIGHYRRALDILEERGEPNHPLVGALLNNIGVALRRQGDLEEALTYLERAVEHTRRVLGEESEDYEVQLSSLGRVLGQLGRFEEANRALDQARGVAEKLYGTDHPFYAWHLVNKARMRQLQNDHAAALALLDEAIPVYRAAYGDYHPFLAAAEIGYAVSSFETGDVQGAAAQARETLDRMREYPDHERHVEALGRSILGRALGRLGHDVEARELLTGAVASQRELYGDEHPLTAQTAGYLVEFLDERGETGEANRYRGLTAAR